MKRAWATTWILFAACEPAVPPIDLGDDEIHIDDLDEGLAILPPGGSFEESVEVTLVPVIEGSKVYYSLDGTPPIPTDGKLYEAPLELEATTLVSAMAVTPDGMWTQAISSLFEHAPVPGPREQQARSLRLSREQLVFVARPDELEMVRSLQVMGAGLEPIQIVDVELSQNDEDDGTRAFTLLDDLNDVILQPGERKDLRVRFVATRTYRSARLFIRSDASHEVSQELEVQLHGRLFQ